MTKKFVKGLSMRRLLQLKQKHHIQIYWKSEQNTEIAANW